MFLDDADLPTINPFDPEYVADPYPIYSKVSASTWIAKCPLGGMVLGQAEMRALLRDDRLREPQGMLGMFGIFDGPFHQWFTTQMVMAEPEVHDRLRRLIGGAFKPSQAEKARPIVRTILDEQLRRVESTGTCDFVADISSIFPLRVFCRLIGVPDSDVPSFAKWANAMGLGMDVDVSPVLTELDDAVVNLSRYVAGLVDHSRKAEVVEGDLLQSLAMAIDDGQQLTAEELVSLIILLLTAGSDTTANALAWGMVVLLDHEELWARMAREPEIVPRVVEELLRIRPPAGVTVRMVVDDVDFGGLTFPAGTYLMMANAAANNDPRQYDAPEILDIDRPDSGHVTFGYGPHSCVGAHLARAELQEALIMLTRRLRSPRLAGEITFGTPLGIHSVDSLPIRFDPVT